MKICRVIFCIVLVLASLPGNAENAPEKERYAVSLEGMGTVILETNTTGSENSQLILQKPGGMRELIDNFDGLLPADLRKFDLNSDGNAEIISLLRHPDGLDVMPYIYLLRENFARIYPPEDQSDKVPIICREVVLTANDNIPLLCAKNPVIFHDFGPPDLFQLEFYRINGQQLELFERTFSSGDHFNILMNRGAVAYNDARYLEAIDFYEQAISSSSGEISSKAFVEAAFFLAESRKLSKDFSGALELYQKIVLEFPQNHRTDQAQKEIELISAENHAALSLLVDVSVLVNSNKWEEALALISQLPPEAEEIEDRFLFIKAEILAAQNRIDEAIASCKSLGEKYPDSPLLEEANRLLQDMQGNPEDSGGL